MAIVQNPITGRSRGKFATAVFAKQFGKNTMRSKPIQVSNPRTQAQKEQRTKFALIVELSRMFLGFLKISYKQVAVGMSQFNVFMKSNISTAITGTFPNYAIDFTQLIVSKGTLMGADTPEADTAAGRKVNFSWVDNSGQGDALATDKAMALLINYERKAAIQDVITKTRADGSLSVTAPANWVGETVYVYFSFMTEGKDKVADSQYLGELVITA